MAPAPRRLEPMRLLPLPRRTRTNPVFYADELRLELPPERFERALTGEASVDLLVWNVFASLDTHDDRDWLAYRLQSFGGASARAPIRISLWRGRDRGPLLTPSPGHVRTIRARVRAAGADETTLSDLDEPVEVPVRIETPETLVLVDALVRGGYPPGPGGRDRLLAIIDAGLEQARRLSKQLAVAVVYPLRAPGAADASRRMSHLRDPANLAAALPHHSSVPQVPLREVTWQQLLHLWEQELAYLDLSGQPVRAFRQYAANLSLR
jgi:hypothetical protein